MPESTSDTPPTTIPNLAEQVRATLAAARASLSPPAPSSTSAPAQQQAAPAPKYNPALPSWYYPHINSDTFDLNRYLTEIPHIDTLMNDSEGRQILTRNDPLLFALTYLPHHLKDQNLPLLPPSFADCHFDWCRSALKWAANRNRNTDAPPSPQEDRIAEIAPRMCGKSTWWFLILPLWAAAHGHKRFIAAFASTATQAEKHLATFKKEIDSNRHLRADYPDLCAPKRRPRGAIVADRVDEYQSQSGFVFIAKGVDSSNLGMKVEEQRPDLLLLDDVEPDEASYSPLLAQKRLHTITDAIFPLNVYASVVFVGTVTMPNSIIHQLVKHARGQQTYDWINDENIKPHYYAPIVSSPTSSDPTHQRSLWPQKWSLDFLKSIQHTRSYAKNYANDPRGLDGDYWNDGDFTYGPPSNNPKSRTALFIDPPTTSSRTSDPAGLAIVTWYPPTKTDFLQQSMPNETNPAANTRKATNRVFTNHPGRVSIRYANEAKLTGRPLAKFCYKLIQSRPDLNVRRLIVEATQGGDLWLEVFNDSPLLVEITNPREGKEERFGRALEYYQKRPTLVEHDSSTSLARLEEQMLGFPKMAHDDIADAAVSGILYFLEPRPKKRKVRTRSTSYV